MGNIFDEKSIVNRNKIYDVPEGITILTEGEINLDMYKIVSGHVEMYTGYGTENEILIGLLGPGTCFGEFGLLTGRPAIYTIITYSKTKILRVTEALMGDFIKDNPESIMQIMKNMANNMMRMQHQISQLSNELADANDIASEMEALPDSMKDMIKNYAFCDVSEKNQEESIFNGAKMHYLDKRK
ncbi:MAG: Crp/Fnr family transcriptional regulator [Pseudobutyrivibrio sp.]|nr:Crp/Fnr family transcriptional regulator [Pseudobutyrivibrio sp.]